MAKSWNRTETWVTLIVLGIAAVVVGMFGLYMYVSATATPIHPDPNSVPSAAGVDASQKWAGAVERARQVARAGLSEQNLPGLSVAVGVGGEMVWAEGFGWADLENRIAVTPATRFRIGTVSKVLTSAAVGLLLEKDQFELDEPIQTYVPEFPKKQWPVTLRHLLAHTSGLRSDSGDEGPLFGQSCERPVDALPAFADRELRFEPGTQYSYSDYGWIVVSAAIDGVGGKDFLAFMRDRVFEPLGMRDTTAESLNPIANRATFYFPRFGGDPRYGPDLIREMHLSCYSGASVFLSTPSDLVRFGLATQSGKLLQPSTVELLQTSQRLPSGQETGYGLGWDVESVAINGEQTRVVGHDGEVLGGLVGSFMMLPNGIVVAVMSNTSYAETPAVALKIAEAFSSARQ